MTHVPFCLTYIRAKKVFSGFLEKGEILDAVYFFRQPLDLISGEGGGGEAKKALMCGVEGGEKASSIRPQGVVKKRGREEGWNFCLFPSVWEGEGGVVGAFVSETFRCRSSRLLHLLPLQAVPAMIDVR